MKNKKQENILLAEMTNKEFLVKNRCAIHAVEAKLEMIDAELSMKEGRMIINSVTSRIKQPESAKAKLIKKGYNVTFQNAVEKLNDIAGIRVVCTYLDDIYAISSMLKKHNDIIVLKEKDYIKNTKVSGYRSLHLIVQVPIYFHDANQNIRVEVQLRTVAMDFWAGLDHQLRYKKSKKETALIGSELKKYAEIIKEVDEKMLKLRHEIEAI